MCRKKKAQINEIEVEFITICTKGEDPQPAGEPRELDQLFSKATEKSRLSDLVNAIDDDGDQPLHIAAECGNAEVVEWILSKSELDAKVNTSNGNNLTPLFLACLKGYVGAEGMGARTDSVKHKRLRIARLLVEKGANVNQVREVVNMTPLHWAAFHDDADLVRFLLAKGARQMESAAGSMPVDVAGFMGNKKVLKVFMEYAA